MSGMHYQPDEPAALSLIARWCRRLLGLPAGTEAPDCCAPHVEPSAEASPQPLNRAGRWPDTTSLMVRRIAAVGADADSVREFEQQCLPCASKDRCERDLAQDPGGDAWRGYYASTKTLQQLSTNGPQRNPEDA
jgi:hypothetical protein